MATPVVVTNTLIRPTYGLEFRVHAHGFAGRLQIETTMPTPVGVFTPNTTPITIHNAWYEVGAGADDMLFGPTSYFSVWEWFPAGTIITMTSNPAVEDAVVVSNLCCDITAIGPGYDSRFAQSNNATRSTIRAIDATAQTFKVQTHQFTSLTVGMVNTGAGIMAFSLVDAESGRVIASGTVAAGASDTVVLTQELPDALLIKFAAVANATGILSVKGNCL